MLGLCILKAVKFRCFSMDLVSDGGGVGGGIWDNTFGGTSVFTQRVECLVVTCTTKNSKHIFNEFH